MTAHRIRIGVGQLHALDAETAAWARPLGITTFQMNTPAIPGDDGYWHEADLRRLRDDAAAEGLTLDALENVPVAFYDRVMLGRGWEDQLDNYCRTIRNMGRVGIGLLGHHFMPTFVWRTALDTPGRGGALVTSFDADLVPLGNKVVYPQAPPTEQATLAEMRVNYGRFLDAVLPVAEAAGVRLALHPDDPPVPAIGGVARLFTSPDDLAWAMERSNGSPAWGMDLCLGTVSEMIGGPDAVRRAIDLLGPRGRIFYVHLRQVQGTVPRFAECFIGEGNYSPADVIRQLVRVGFDGFLLDDHVPHMTGDTPYGHRARAHAIGYMQGLLAAIEGGELMRIVVTGAAGGIGRYVVPDLVAHGHAVVAVDRAAPGTTAPGAGGVGATAPGQVAPVAPFQQEGAIWHLGDSRDEALMARAVAGADALIHLAAIPTPLLGTAREVFATNTQATFVALEAAGVAGLRAVAVASSISLLGLPYATTPLSPLYAPVDEAHPNIGTDAYALSKEVDEATAAMMQRRHGYQAVALRICATAPMELHQARQREVAKDPTYLSNELWAYLDVRDAARAFVLSVERDIPGFHVINVMAPDTYSALPTADLMARSHPGTPLRRPLVGRESVLDTTRCRELLGFEPRHRLDFGGA